MITCGEAIISLLEAHGVEVVFGIPGVHTVELYRGLAGSGIRHVAPQHEQSAGFMADGYARASGRPGVCLLITGPGLTNAATALAQSYSDSVPVLAVSSVNRVGELGLGRGLLHELPDQSQLAGGFTAFSHTLLQAQNLPAVLQRAFDSFACARPRPVHIEVPMDVLDAPMQEIHPASIPPSPPVADEEGLRRAASLLAGARCPLLVLGGGTVNAAAQARELVDSSGIPVVLTTAAKGVVPAAHPLCFGSTLTSQAMHQVICDADVVAAIGTELSDTDVWRNGQPLQFQGQLIRIDIDVHQIRRNAWPELALVGDAGQALSALTRGLQGNNRHRDGAGRVARALAAILSAETPGGHRHRRVLDIIRGALPENGLVTADSTQIVYTGNLAFEACTPRSWLTSTTGYGTLGYALPAAIGARLACPDRPTICLAGDGGALFTLPELAVAVRERLPMAVVVWCNDGYREIRDAMVARQVDPVGTDFTTPDLVGIARGFGCQAARAESTGHLAELIHGSFDAPGPTLIELRADAPFLD